MDANLFLNSPIVALFMTLCFIGVVFLAIGFRVGAEIIISPLKGFVVGAIVNDDTFIEDNKQITEYTLQCLIGIISINVVWEVNG